jgi:hypothetical protein
MLRQAADAEQELPAAFVDSGEDRTLMLPITCLEGFVGLSR